MPVYTDFNCTLTAYGMDTYGQPTDWPLRALQVSYGLNIIGQEDQAGAVKTFYARQVQEDQFAVVVVFVNAKERRDFFTWYQAYAQYATSPGPVGPMRVQVPSRGFDFLGTLTDGVQEQTTVPDVTWRMTLQFQGAQPTVSLSDAYLSDAVVPGPGGSSVPIYQPPANDPLVGLYFYPDLPPLAQSTAVSSSNTAAVEPSDLTTLRQGLKFD